MCVCVCGTFAPALAPHSHPHLMLIRTPSLFLRSSRTRFLNPDTGTDLVDGGELRKRGLRGRRAGVRGGGEERDGGELPGTVHACVCVCVCVCMRACVCAGSVLGVRAASSRPTTTLYSEPAAHDVHLRSPITRNQHVSVPDYCQTPHTHHTHTQTRTQTHPYKHTLTYAPFCLPLPQSFHDRSTIVPHSSHDRFTVVPRSSLYRSTVVRRLSLYRAAIVPLSFLYRAVIVPGHCAVRQPE